MSGDARSKIDGWALQQWPEIQQGFRQGAAEIGRDFVSDVGNTYQAFLMGDASWRVPRAHDDFTLEIATEAAAAEIEQEFAQPSPDLGPSPDMDR